MDPKLFNLLGLLLCAAGGAILAYGLIVSGRRALEVGLPLMASESDAQNACLPHVRDRMRQSRFALIGVVVMTLGFLLQTVGSWPGLAGPSAEQLTPPVQYVRCD